MNFIALFLWLCLNTQSPSLCGKAYFWPAPFSLCYAICHRGHCLEAGFFPAGSRWSQPVAIDRAGVGELPYAPHAGCAVVTLQTEKRKPFLGKIEDAEVMLNCWCSSYLTVCHSTGSDPLTASWKSPQNTKTVVTLAVMDNIIPQRALDFAGRKENVLKAFEDLAGRTLVSKSSLNCVFSSLSRFWPWLSPVLSHWTSFIHRSCACTQLGGKGERITIFKCSFLR